MTKNKLTIKVNADTTEALQQMKELTEAANECAAALEKLEMVMGKFTGSGLIASGAIEVDFDVAKVAEPLTLQAADGIKRNC